MSWWPKMNPVSNHINMWIWVLLCWHTTTVRPYGDVGQADWETILRRHHPRTRVAQEQSSGRHLVGSGRSGCRLGGQTEQRVCFHKPLGNLPSIFFPLAPGQWALTACLPRPSSSFPWLAPRRKIWVEENSQPGSGREINRLRSKKRK